MAARDYRFDGKFFVGVKTTGIYCRPICPAKPKRENVEFFSSALDAERAGYRPCLRCRPECAPLSPAWAGTSSVVQRALKLIAANGLLDSNEDEFAAKLGLGARHLRRLFDAEIGQTPKQISDNHRLNFSRKLIVETQIPILAVAMSAGFSSLRRFNDAFKKRFRRAPSEVRKQRPGAGANADANMDDGQGIELSLAIRPPFDWKTLIGFFRIHRIPGIETATENTFSRVFRIGNSSGQIFVWRVPDEPSLKLRVITSDPKILFDVVQRVRRMFDLDSDPLLIMNSFSEVPILRRLCERNPGLRLPRGWDPFETAICAILGQCVSVAHASALIGQLVHAYGDAAPNLSGAQARFFPTPECLARSDLSRVHTTGARKATIREFSKRIMSGALTLSEAQDPAAFRKKILEIDGIGPWSSEYICLRAIGDTDAFPGSDLILKRALERYSSLNLDLVKPWRSYAAIYLWNDFANSPRRFQSRRRRNKHALLQCDEFASRTSNADCKQ